MKKRIWFNRWFRTGTDFIDRIREMDIDGEYEIYVTHHNQNKEYIKRADYFALDSRERGKKYIEFCLKFCKKHSIDVFIPKYCLNDISEYREEFEKIGVKVLLAAEKEVMRLVSHKVDFYEDCRKYNIVHIPDYFTVKTLDEFKSACKKILEKKHTVCYKTIISEGGMDFRIVYNTNQEKKSIIADDDAVLISFENAIKELSKKKKFHPIMVMEYLDGVEYSIDCLAYKGELLVAVPRKKVEWNRILEDNAKLIKLAEEITKIYNFSYAYNVQVRYKDGVPKLLEVNPRMSGGLNSSCMSGINFPFLALELLVKGVADIPKPKFGLVTNTEDRGHEIIKKKGFFIKGIGEKR